MLKRPLLIGRGPWAQKIYAALGDIGVVPTISGSMTAVDDIREAHKRGNDGIIIASKTPSHYELLQHALMNRLPIFCEKPLVSSLAQAYTVEALWRLADRPTFICDFVHLWSEGFEYACSMYSELKPLPKFHAVFGGNVQRSDTHPVWDYGSHPIAMALLLGVDLRDLEMHPCVDCPYEWELANAHASIHVRAGPPDSPLPQKYARAWMDGVFRCEDGVWSFPLVTGAKDNKDAPPLQRALRHFVSATQGPLSDRAGVALPLKVTKVLESLCKSESPFK